MSGHDFQQVGGMSGSGSMLVIFCRRCGEVRRVPVA
jgi:RNase P subunit RPR2